MLYDQRVSPRLDITGIHNFLSAWPSVSWIVGVELQNALEIIWFI